jgi:hypothetical protein
MGFRNFLASIIMEGKLISLLMCVVLISCQWSLGRRHILYFNAAKLNHAAAYFNCRTFIFLLGSSTGKSVSSTWQSRE